MSALDGYTAYMRLAGLSPVTIEARVEILTRLRVWLAGPPITAATRQQLTAWQQQFAGLAPASIDIYTRHVQAFFRWAVTTGLLEVNPAADLPRPRVKPGLPHPTTIDDLRIVFACTTGALRIVFALATFAGARRGEIIQLRRTDVDLTACTVLLHGKGDKDRIVPIVAPLADELAATMPPHGYVVLHNGRPYVPDTLSTQCNRHLRELGVRSTLHSMRHAYATNVYRSTRDLLLVAQLLGHSSVRTTQIYAQPDMDAMQSRLSAVSDMAAGMLSPARLRAVG